MILLLSVPDLPNGATQVRVASWRVEEGGAVAFGDVVVDLVVERRAWVDRGTSASKVVSLLGRGRRAGSSPADTSARLDRSTNELVEVVAAETGFLSEVLAPVGGVVPVTAGLARMATDSGEVGDGSDATLPFRAVARVAEIGLDHLRSLDRDG